MLSQDLGGFMLNSSGYAAVTIRGKCITSMGMSRHVRNQINQGGNKLWRQEAEMTQAIMFVYNQQRHHLTN